MARCKSTSKRAWLWRAPAFAVAVTGAFALTLWGLGCSALLNIDRFSLVPSGGADGGRESGTAEPEYVGLVFTLVDMFPHKDHYFEYRVVDSQNMILARGAVEPVGLGTLSNTGADTPLTAPRVIPNANATDGPFRLDFFAETSMNNRSSSSAISTRRRTRPCHATSR